MTIDMDSLTELQDWFAAQCDGAWEHQHGITIESCDNPGWWVKIDLAGTSIANRFFDPMTENVDADGHPLGSRWMNCHVVGGVWHGAGDETKLPTLLQIFLTWATGDP